MATKTEQVNNLYNSLHNLVVKSDFLTDFQKSNYSIIVAHYHDSADDLAEDYDNFKTHYDKLKDTDPKKAQYKAKLEETENKLNPFLNSLNSITTEINNMEIIINKLNDINTKLDNLKGTGGTSTPTPTADLSNLATKEDINEVKTSIGNIKITPTDLTPTNEKLDNLDKKVDNIKLPNVDLTNTNEEIKGLGGKIDNLKFPNVDFTPTNDKITGLENKLDTIKTNTEKPQTIPCPCDIKGMADKMDKINSQISSLPSIKEQKQKKAINAFLVNDKDIQNKNKEINQAIPKNKEEWVKVVKTDPTNRHLTPWQDPKTGKWGVIHSAGASKIYYTSPANESDWKIELAEVLTYLKTQGIATEIVDITWGFYNMNKENSQEYSYLWAIGTINYISRVKWDWEALKDESKWKPQAEAIIKQYDN